MWVVLNDFQNNGIDLVCIYKARFTNIDMNIIYLKLTIEEAFEEKSTEYYYYLFAKIFKITDLPIEQYHTPLRNWRRFNSFIEYTADPIHFKHEILDDGLIYWTNCNL
jgi:hypothetical protein